MTAMRISPPDYIVKELGERLTDRAKARAWDRGTGVIEGYRQENGVTGRQKRPWPRATERVAARSAGGRAKETAGGSAGSAGNCSSRN